MTDPSTELDGKYLQEVAVTLDALLRVRYASDADQAQRDKLALDFLRNEARRYRPKLATVRSLDELFSQAGDLQPPDLEVIRNRCLFYGCDNLIALLARKRVGNDVIAREEAMLYVQDRLQRDDFRRIRSFRPERGASFVTYMWQVINNLLLDFVRAHRKLPTKVGVQSDAPELALEHAVSHDSGSTSMDSVPHEPSADTAVESHQLHDMLAELMTEASSTADKLHPIRERLRPHLNLTSKERVFVRALFQYDMTINEVRELPVFAMNVNEAYRFYYRIMDQLLAAFKAAGILDSMRSLVSDVAPRVSVSIAGEVITVAATRIHYLEELDRGSTRCHADWQGTTASGVIGESFSKLSKRLAAYFSHIDSTTAVADKILAATYRDWSNATGAALRIAGVPRSFEIAKRQLPELKARFAEKSST
jgi:hypothetical protein